MLRKCNHCGIEASTIAELELFPKDKTCLHDRKPTCRVCRKSLRSKRIYGISSDEADFLLKKQGGGCAICGATESQSSRHAGKPLHIDHSHKTGEVRGILCEQCNRGLGLFRDDTSLLDNAIKYLNKT